MRLLRRSSPGKAAPSIPLLVLLAAAVVTAQNTDTATQQQTTNTNTATQQTTQTGTQTQAQTTATGTTAKPQTITDVPTLTSGDDSATSDVPTTAVTNAPSITDTSSIFHLTGVPTIAGYGIPTPIVPWTGGAAYMQRSQLPEGTVFIAVGSILAFMALAILAWRGLVAWSLHRSVKRAAANALKTDSMTKLSKPTTHYRGMSGLAGSNHSLDRLSAAPARLTKTSHGNPPGTAHGAARNSSLFFSPTAGAGNHTSPAAALLNTANNRSSAYLPAGYYAAPGAATPASTAGGMTTLGGTSPSPLSSLNPITRAGYRPQRDFGPSPPASPPLPPSRISTDSPGRRGNGGYAGGYERMSAHGGSGQAGLYNQSSVSNLNLHAPGGNINGGRAPSANLEELFENHGNGPRERF